MGNNASVARPNQNRVNQGERQSSPAVAAAPYPGNAPDPNYRSSAPAYNNSQYYYYNQQHGYPNNTPYYGGPGRPASTTVAYVPSSYPATNSSNYAYYYYPHAHAQPSYRQAQRRSRYQRSSQTQPRDYNYAQTQRHPSASSAAQRPVVFDYDEELVARIASMGFDPSLVVKALRSIHEKHLPKNDMQLLIGILLDDINDRLKTAGVDFRLATSKDRSKTGSTATTTTTSTAASESSAASTAEGANTSAACKGDEEVDIDDVDERQVCKICWERVIDTVILPCGHLCMCLECAKLGLNACPICQEEIAQFHRVYWS